MKAENILTQIGVNQTPRNKEHARKLVEIYKMLSGIKSDIVSAERSQTEFNFGKETRHEDYRDRYEDRYVRIEGTTVKAERFTIKTKTGTYTQTIPVNNDLHRAFCELIGQPVTETEAPIFSVTFNKEQTKFIKKAVCFCSTDPLRPAMMHMKLEFSPGQVQVIATDGHRLLKQVLQVETDQTRELLIPAKNLRVPGSTLEVQLFDGHYKLNSQTFKIEEIEGAYPDYMSVWPEHKGEIVVNRDELLHAVKSMLPTANKTTKALRFYFNGNVKIEAEDLDFANESGLSIEYKGPKTAPDFKIGLNAKFLIDALETLPRKQKNLFETVTIKSDGAKDKAILINDSALVMPVKLLAEYEEEVSNG